MENTCLDQTTIEVQPVTPPAAQPVMTLDDYAKAISEAHRNCETIDKESRKKGREAVQWAYKAGQYLNAIKDLIPHGEWLPWLKQNCPEIKERVAQRYMVAAKNVRGSDLEHFTGVRQYEIATGARSPEKIDKAPESVDGETAEVDGANTPEILLNAMQRGFATLQRQYASLVTLHPKLQTHLLGIDLNWSLPILLQRWQYPLGDAFDFFNFPWTPAVCVRCGHIRQDDEIFAPIHHWVPEYAQRNEWCDVCAEEYYDEEEPFNLAEEIKLLTENLNELKALPVKDYTLVQKLYQLQETKIAEPDIIAVAENNVWMPTDLNDKQVTVAEIGRLSPKIVIANNDETKALWNVYRHFVSSAVNHLPPTRNVRFLVVDDSKPNKPVLGLGAISGDFLALGERDTFIGWTKEQREAGKLKHTAVGSTIIATQPFGSNFNGGKLIAALITSQMIRDEWQSLTGCLLAGLTTTSLFGVPSMYDRIKQWKRLCVAKLDRLSRNLHFVTTLQNSKVDFVAADNPHATPFLIHIHVAVAENERQMISTRTKEALAAAKRRGVKLGNPYYQTAISKAVEVRQQIADQRNFELRQMVQEVMDKTGLTKLADIAQALNLRGIKTNRGCEFTPTQIHRLLKNA